MAKIVYRYRNQKTGRFRSKYEIVHTKLKGRNKNKSVRVVNKKYFA